MNPVPTDTEIVLGIPPRDEQPGLVNDLKRLP
jgi:hypothetical protein